MKRFTLVSCEAPSRPRHMISKYICFGPEDREQPLAAARAVALEQTHCMPLGLTRARSKSKSIL